MHDPCTLAFDIYLGKKAKKNGHYRTPFISIWHKDPEKDGSDDSCGWFIRSRHIDPALVEKVRKEFAFNFKHNYWFDKEGKPVFSVPGTVLNLYNQAAWHMFMFWDGDKPTDRARRKYRNFMRKYLFDILIFAENPTDCVGDSVIQKFGKESENERINHFVSVITADIMRKLRPWYKHPRWHIHHWQITFPLFRSFYRKYFQRCSKCNKVFGKSNVYSNWSGSEKWCDKCEGSKVVC